jgi:hypothetical protein
VATRGICKVCQLQAHTEKALYCLKHKEERTREVNRESQSKYRRATGTELVLKIGGMELFNLRKSVSDLLLLNQKLKKELERMHSNNGNVKQDLLESLVINEVIVSILSKALPGNFSLDKAPWSNIYNDYINVWIDGLPSAYEASVNKREIARYVKLLRKSLP